ncbi:hypothetical protein PIB30_025536 [Stylosanthes scabra]|uniref:Uncharacterized protein n=1 Tax=Stylosanthes scabra TaxID=79078 RepID=A0ABU6Z7S8_9FABA|nr:hypothetical protein [Stylosanthes scabra]
MNPITFLIILLPLFAQFLGVEPARAKVPGKSRSSSSLRSPTSQISVMGFVYCDMCSNNTFSRHSYFLSGAEVKIECMFKAVSSKTVEEVSVSANRTTNKYGLYRVEIPSVDGVRCAQDSEHFVSNCKASLIGSSTSSCNVPGYRTTSDQISIKAKRSNLCIYSLNALNFRPSKRDTNLCGH